MIFEIWDSEGIFCLLGVIYTYKPRNTVALSISPLLFTSFIIFTGWSTLGRIRQFFIWHLGVLYTHTYTPRNALSIRPPCLCLLIFTGWSTLGQLPACGRLAVVHLTFRWFLYLYFFYTKEYGSSFISSPCLYLLILTGRSTLGRLLAVVQLIWRKTPAYLSLLVAVF